MNQDTKFNEPIGTNKTSFLVDGDPYRLAGNHTWNTVQSFGRKGRRNYASLNDIKGNFTRLWTIEPGKVNTRDSNPQWRVGKGNVFNISPTLYRRRRGKYDLSRPNKAFLNRLETVVSRLDDRDIVSGVVLSDGAWNRFFGPTSWKTHPFNPKNNIQNIGPSNINGVHSIGKWNKYQRRLYSSIIKTLKPYNNVIYEIGNELHRSSIPWQNRMVNFVNKKTDKPVGVSYVTRTNNFWMNKTKADFIVPNLREGTPTVKKPIIFDTDHGWALRSNISGLKKYWREGRDLWLMDSFEEGILRNIDNLRRDRDYISGLPLGKRVRKTKNSK